MTSPPRILVAHKKSRYEKFVLHGSDARITALVEEDHVSVHNLESSHRAHSRSLEELVGYLDQSGIAYDLKYRGDVEGTADYDLVIAVGGDGTVLDLSHRIDGTPIVAINSDPETSIGYFTAGTAFDFPRIIEEILDDGIDPIELGRFHVLVDGVRTGPAVLNDILVSHHNPAAVSTYLLKVGAHPAESQKSSGLWVSTPAGSTAAIRSAGGLVLPFDSENLQYLVREPCPPREGGYRFLKGIQPADEHFEIISQMQEGMLFIDGPHLAFDFPIGASLTIDTDAPPLAIHGLQVERRTA